MKVKLPSSPNNNSHYLQSPIMIMTMLRPMNMYIGQFKWPMIGCYHHHIENITISQCRIITNDSCVMTNNYDVTMFGQMQNQKNDMISIATVYLIWYNFEQSHSIMDSIPLHIVYDTPSIVKSISISPNLKPMLRIHFTCSPLSNKVPRASKSPPNHKFHQDS